MLFGILPRRDAAPPADPVAVKPPATQGGFGRLRQACADALDAITAARPAVAVAQRDERLSLRPLTERSPAGRRVDPLMAARTGQDRPGRPGQVLGQPGYGIPPLPPVLR